MISEKKYENITITDTIRRINGYPVYSILGCYGQLKIGEILYNGQWWEFQPKLYGFSENILHDILDFMRGLEAGE